ncbi:hypothetical protein ABPG72_003927 [Tetrahymena utriculariae]
MRLSAINQVTAFFYIAFVQYTFAQWMLTQTYFTTQTLSSLDLQGWSNTLVSTCSNYDNLQILGGLAVQNGSQGFGYGTQVSKLLSNLPNHTQIKVVFTVYFLQSSSYDIFQNAYNSVGNLSLNADGNQQFTTQFPDFTQNLRNYCQSNSYRVIKTYNVQFSHTARSLQLTFKDSFLGASNLYGWGIRDIKVYLTSCNYSCATCSGVNDQCSACSQNAVSTVNGQYCQCQSGYYPSSLQPFLCSQCNPTCAQCFGSQSTNCIQCKANAILLNGECVCNAGYRMDLNGNCIPCYFTCSSCVGNGSSDCLSCYCTGQLVNVNPTTNTGTCQCLPGYSLISQTQFTCGKCNQTCLECNKTNMNQCTSCPPNASLATAIDNYGNQLCSCNGGYFAVQTNPLRCMICQPSCKTCSALFTCDSCFQNSQLVSGQCVCSPGFYPDPNNPINCLPCNHNCATCSSQNICTSCVSKAYISNGSCQCIDGYYANYQGTQLVSCQKCDPTCQKCVGGSSNQCTNCRTTAVLSNVSNGIGTCQCIQYFYAAQLNPFICAPCDPTCASCSQSGPTNCDTCLPNMIRNGFLCQCQSGMYFDSNKRVCLSCPRFCGTCQADCPDTCLSCSNPDTILVGIKCVPKPGKFVNPSGDVQNCDASCYECSGPGPKKCTSCKGSLVLQNASCVCPAGSSIDQNSSFTSCITCDPSCLQCNGPNPNNCISCQQNYVSNGNGSCYCNLSQGWYLDKYGKCLKCHMNCKTCTGGEIYQCLTCLNNASPVDGYCICNNGSYTSQAYPLACSLCHDTCKNCTGSCQNKCTECFENANLVNGSCVCQKGYFRNPDNNDQCEQCSINCFECSGDSNNCIKCVANSKLINGSCVCLDGYTFNPTNGQCEQCGFSCLRCSYVDKNVCTDCTPNAYLNGNTCVCSNGYFAVKSCTDILQCQACHPSCQNCLNNNSSYSCASCYSNFDFVKSSCDAATQTPLG